MKFPSLPYLAQKRVLKQMKYDDVFKMSLVSKRIETLILTIEWSEIKSICYIAKDNYILDVYICTREENSPVTDRASALRDRILTSLGAKNRVLLLKMFRKADGEDTPIKDASGRDYPRVSLQSYHVSLLPRLQIERINKKCIIHSGEDKVPFLAVMPSVDLILKSENLNDDPAVEAIHKQIDRIFGRHATYELKTESKNPEKTFLPAFIQVNKTVFSEMKEPQEKMEVQVLEDYLSFQPKQDLISFSVQLFNGPFGANSKMFEADTLEVKNAFETDIFTNLFFNIKNRMALFYNVCCEDQHVIELVRKWKNQESYRQLHLLIIGNTLRRLFNTETIQQAIGFKELQWSGTQPVVDFYPRSVFERRARSVLKAISSYIVRNDGIVAYVNVSNRDFVFEVQEFTENQMMEKYASSSSEAVNTQ